MTTINWIFHFCYLLWLWCENWLCWEHKGKNRATFNYIFGITLLRVVLGEPTVWSHWPWPRTIVATCKGFLTIGCPVKECRTSKLPPARSSGNIKRREKTSVHMSYQPPRILLAGNHLGWMMSKPPGKTLSQSDWPEPTPKLTQLP